MTLPFRFQKVQRIDIRSRGLLKKMNYIPKVPSGLSNNFKNENVAYTLVTAKTKTCGGAESIEVGNSCFKRPKGKKS